MLIEYNLQCLQLRESSWSVTIVLVSDNPSFLAAVADWSFHYRLLQWPTRFLALTRGPLPQLAGLHQSFSMMNALLLLVEGTSRTSLR